MYSEVEALNNQIIFEFVEDNNSGHFNSKTAGGVMVVEQQHKQVDVCRWGRILNVGPDVDEFEPLQIVLIKQLRWTNHFIITDKKYWITQDTEIIALWDDTLNLPY